MKMKTVEMDDMIWKRQRPINQEVASLIADLMKAEKGVTYEVELEKPMKSLKASLNKHVPCAAKAKDKTFRYWYVKVVAQTRKSRKSKETAKE